MQRHARHLLCLFLVVAFAACRGGDTDPPTATLRETASPQPESSTLDSSDPATDLATIPEAIDALYVESVLQSLYHVESEALRLAVAAELVTPESMSHLQSVYQPDLSAQQIEVVEAGAAAGFPNTIKPPGDLQVTVDEVVTATESCIWAIGLRDYSSIVEEPASREGERDYFLLTPLDPSQDPRDLNPTPWAIAGVASASISSEPVNPCL